MAECANESLAKLAYLVTGHESDSNLLSGVGKIERGTEVDINPLLSKLEERLRDSTVTAARNLNTNFPYVDKNGLKFMDLTINGFKLDLIRTIGFWHYQIMKVTSHPQSLTQ